MLIYILSVNGHNFYRLRFYFDVVIEYLCDVIVVSVKTMHETALNIIFFEFSCCGLAPLA